MEVGGREGMDFHPPLEPLVIINDQADEEEENFFRKLHLCRKSSLKSKQILQADRFRNHLGFLENQFKSRPTRQSGNSATRSSRPLEQCPTCKKYFRRMKTHRLKHEMAEKRLRCRICSKMFDSPGSLQTHARCHVTDKRYACAVCDKTFTQNCNLVNHVRTHTGEKPYKCPHCERAFTQSGNLANHIRVHTSEKPFKCHYCAKAFAQSGNLNSHIRNTHRLD